MVIIATVYAAEIFNDLWSIVFPKLCLACEQSLSKSEVIICISCQVNLPRTDYHLYADNPVAKHFWGKVPVQASTALFHFHKSSRIQHLLHALKYKGNREVGIRLGKLLGYQLKDHEIFNSIDMITSVPLHRKREIKRGYNQSSIIGEGLSEVLHKPFDGKILRRLKFTETQTRKSRLERWENVKELFEVTKPAIISNKHILLIDDVITTGSTLEACIVELIKTQGVKVSIAAIAHAEQ